MESKALVASIMTNKVIVADKNRHNLRDILQLFKKEKIRHIPILENQHLVGIISQNDMNRLTFGALFDDQDTVDETVLDMLSIDQVMTSKPTAISPQTTIEDAAKIIVDKRFHSLPVVEDGKICGIITSTDIIRHFLA